MPTTYSTPAGSIAAVTRGSMQDMFKTYVVSKEVDIDALGALVSNDVIQCIPVAAGTFVSKVFVEILRVAAGTSGSITVGDGADADGYDTTVDLKATVGTVTYNGVASNAAATHGDNAANVLVDAYAAGKFYSAADTIDVTVTLHADLTDKGKIRVTAICADI